jgi:hypothetical protein
MVKIRQFLWAATIFLAPGADKDDGRQTFIHYDTIPSVTEGSASGPRSAASEKEFDQT